MDQRQKLTLAFSLQLADLYGETLGGWTRPLVLVAALTTMLSTLLTVVDGFPRAIDLSIAVMRSPDGTVHGDAGVVYWWAPWLTGALVVLLLSAFGGTLTALVDFATIVSFLTAPILGYLKLRVVTGPAMPLDYRPGPAMLAFSYTGLVLLAAFGAIYLTAGR